MVEGDDTKCYVAQRHREFTLKLQAVAEKSEKGRPIQNVQKLPL